VRAEYGVREVPAKAVVTLMLSLALVSMNGTERPDATLSLRANAAPSACVTSRSAALRFQSYTGCVSTSLLLPARGYIGCGVCVCVCVVCVLCVCVCVSARVNVPFSLVRVPTRMALKVSVSLTRKMSSQWWRSTVERVG
jgi:hypothetical protein